MFETMVMHLNSGGEWFCGWAWAMLWQSSVVIAALLVLDLVLKNRVRATVRYALWMLVLVKLVLPPSLCVPTGAGYWCNIEPTFQSTEAETQNPKFEIRDKLQIPNTENAQKEGIARRPSESTVMTVAGPAVGEKRGQTPEEKGADPISLAVRWQGLVLLAWAAGVLVLMVLLVQRMLFVRGLIAQSKPAEGRLRETMERCRLQAGVQGDVELRLTENMLSPAACGLTRPVVLMPRTLLESLSRERVRAVLMHELMHIRRRDLWVNMVQTVVQIACFYNPLLWLANARIRVVREQAVDEAALANLGDEACEYGRTLVAVAEVAFSRPHFSLGLVGVVESKKSLATRIRHIARMGIPKSAKVGLAGLVAVVLVGLVLVPMASAKTSAAEFVVKGKVTDATTGKPVAGARVGDDGYAGGLQWTTSDANGNYSYLTWYEEHGVSAEADGYKKQNKGFGTKIFGSEKEKVLNFALAASDVKSGVAVGNDLESLVVSKFIENRDNLKNCVLSWTKTTKDYEKNLEYGGTYQQWWNGSRTTISYSQDQVCSDAGNPNKVWIERREGSESGHSGDGVIGTSFWRLLGQMANSHRDFMVQLRWNSPASLDKMVAHIKKNKDLVAEWSIVEENGSKLVRYTYNAISGKGTRGEEYYDLSQNGALVRRRGYDEQGHVYSEEIRRNQKVADGVWFPVEMECRSISLDGKPYVTQRYVLDVDKCSFNVPKAELRKVFGEMPGFIIKGKVTDGATGKPVAGARVGDDGYAGSKQWTTSDTNGDYSYLTWYEEHNISCSAPGYSTKKDILLTKVLGSEKERVLNFEMGQGGEEASLSVSKTHMVEAIDQGAGSHQTGGTSGPTSSTNAWQNAAEEQFTKKFSVSPGGRLTVDVDFGSITVSASDGNEVTVDVWRKVGRRSAAEAQKFLSEHPVSFTQDGSIVTVKAEHEKENGWFKGIRNRNEAKYIISVPAKFNAKLGTSGGSITVSDLTGEVTAETSGGRLKFTGVQGPLKGETSGGGISVTDCAGDIKIGTSGGGIEVNGGSGTLRGETSGGKIKVKDFRGNTHVGTSGSGLTIENVAGEVYGETSGGGISAVLSAGLVGPVHLETSGGSITLRVPENSAFELDAETSGGGVKCDLPVTTTGKKERDHLKGTVNGGGKSVRLETSGGSIQVKKL